MADYGNEKECGEGLRRAIADGIVTRDEVFVVSKLWNTFHRKEHVREAVLRSLSDWGVSYFDVYYVHFRKQLPPLPRFSPACSRCDLYYSHLVGVRRPRRSLSARMVLRRQEPGHTRSRPAPRHVGGARAARRRGLYQTPRRVEHGQRPAHGSPQLRTPPAIRATNWCVLLPA